MSEHNSTPVALATILPKSLVPPIRMKGRQLSTTGDVGAKIEPRDFSHLSRRRSHQIMSFYLLSGMTSSRDFDRYLTMYFFLHNLTVVWGA